MRSTAAFREEEDDISVKKQVVDCVSAKVSLGRPRQSALARRSWRRTGHCGMERHVQTQSGRGRLVEESVDERMMTRIQHDGVVKTRR